MLFPCLNIKVLIPKITKYLTLQMWYGTLDYFCDAAVWSSCISGTWKASLTMCNCCRSYHTLICHNSGFLHMVFVGLETFATILATRNIRCEKTPEGIGSIITLHLCQVHSSNEMQMGTILNKSLSLSKDKQMFRWLWASYLAFLSLKYHPLKGGFWWCLNDVCKALSTMPGMYQEPNY